jgi:hypothetical protein
MIGMDCKRRENLCIWKCMSEAHRKGFNEQVIQRFAILIFVLQLLCLLTELLICESLHAGLQSIDGIHLGLILFPCLRCRITCMSFGPNEVPLLETLKIPKHDISRCSAVCIFMGHLGNWQQYWLCTHL